MPGIWVALVAIRKYSGTFWFPLYCCYFMLYASISCYLQWFAADLYLDFALEGKIKVQTRESYKKEGTDQSNHLL